MRLVLLFLAALLLAPLPAHAQRSAREYIKQGERLYAQGKYEAAAAALEKAYQVMPDSRLVYNIARAYDQAGRLREAMESYQRYVRLPQAETDPVLLKRATLSMDRLRLQVEKEEAAAAVAEAERQRLRAEAEEAQRRVEAERESARRAEEAHQLSLRAAHEDALATRQRTQVASFALGGVALAGAGVGTLFGLQAREARTGFDAATDLQTKRALAETTRSRALLADIGFGVGLASAVAAVLLYPKRPLPAPGTARLTVAPRGAGAGLEVSF